jgi:energy-coupling factor transporter ATP-binding protein EcfA2
MGAATMSGGNQQKVVIAKWLATEPACSSSTSPPAASTSGTKAEVHRLLSDLAGQGLAILMISSELPEVLGMADRVLVVCEGRLTAELPRDDATPRRHAAATPRPPGADGTPVSGTSTRVADPGSAARSPAARSCARARSPRPPLRHHGRALARDVHPARAAARRGGGDRHDAELPVQRERLARPAADAVDPAAARRRPGARRSSPATSTCRSARWSP